MNQSPGLLPLRTQQRWSSKKVLVRYKVTLLQYTQIAKPLQRQKHGLSEEEMEEYTNACVEQVNQISTFKSVAVAEFIRMLHDFPLISSKLAPATIFSAVYFSPTRNTVDKETI